MTWLECRLRLAELLLMRVDKMTMAESVEARVPFLAHALVEFTMGIRLALKVRYGVPKYLLKKACEGSLPPSLIHRRKMGFGAPMAEWLRGDLGRHAEDTIRRSPLVREGLLRQGPVRRAGASLVTGVFGAEDGWGYRATGPAIESTQVICGINVAAWSHRWLGGRTSV